jgi:hypothetical protein
MINREEKIGRNSENLQPLPRYGARTAAIRNNCQPHPIEPKHSNERRMTKIMTMKLTTIIIAALVIATSAPAGATYQRHHHHRMYHSSAASNNANGTAGGPTTLSGTGSSKYGGSTPGVTGRN